jgi:hypothetical protein
MEINSSQAATAYTTAPSATPAVDSTKLKDQNAEAVKTDLNTENTNTAQKPFEVNITREARELQAAENTEETPPPEPQTEQAPATAQQNSQILNIVA